MQQNRAFSESYWLLHYCIKVPKNDNDTVYHQNIFLHYADSLLVERQFTYIYVYNDSANKYSCFTTHVAFDSTKKSWSQNFWVCVENAFLCGFIAWWLSVAEVKVFKNNDSRGIWNKIFSVEISQRIFIWFLTWYDKIHFLHLQCGD